MGKTVRVCAKNFVTVSKLVDEIRQGSIRQRVVANSLDVLAVEVLTASAYMPLDV